MMVFKRIPEDLDEFSGEMVIAVVGSDEKPLRASNAWLDWRLYGGLNLLLAKEYFKGEFGEKCLLPTYGRFQFDRIVLLGAGDLFRPEAWPETPSGQDLWRNIIQLIEATLQSLKVKNVGLSLPRYELVDQEKALLKLFERAKLPGEMSLFMSRAQNSSRSQIS
jgi:hypothetical protein